MTVGDVLRSAFAWLLELEQEMNHICDRMGEASEAGAREDDGNAWNHPGYVDDA